MTTSARMENKEVPVERVHHDQIKTRPIDEERVAELMSSFTSQGQLQPIRVRPTASGFVVIYGEHRLEAAKRLGWKDIAADVVEVDELSSLELKISENAHRNHFVDPWEEGRIFTRLLNGRYSGDLGKLSAKVGKSTNYIKDRTMVFHQLEPSLRQFVGNKLTVANTIAVAKYTDPYKQLELAKAIIRTRTTNLAQYGGGSMGGTVSVKPMHECTCGCGDIHPIRELSAKVDLGEDFPTSPVVLGTRRKHDDVHISRLGLPQSICGYPLDRTWSTSLPVGVELSGYTITTEVKEPRALCDVCAQAWRNSN